MTEPATAEAEVVERTISRRELLGMCKQSKSMWIYHHVPKPIFLDDFKMVETLNNTQNPLLIDGYIRFSDARNTLNIPREIKHLLFLFYFIQTQYIMNNNFDSFGSICRCFHKQTQTTFAVKEINKNVCFRINHKYRNRILRAIRDEFDILQTYWQQNMVAIKYVYEDESIISIITEECKGGTLFERIIEMRRFTEHEAAKIMNQILQVLCLLYEDMNIVHCDITPQNIYFVNKSDDLCIKIYGFGMSKLIARVRNFTKLQQTPYYTACDIIKYRKYNHGCDMWSVGVILYIMIYGYPPFNADPVKFGKDEIQSLHRKIKRGFVSRIRCSEKYGLGPWFPDHIQRSNEVKDLINKLLAFKARHRYTAREALQHPWIVNEGQTTKTQQPFNMVKLTEFVDLCNFKMNVINFFREQFDTMRVKHFKEIEAFCCEMDTNNDGVISYQQLMDAVAKVKGSVSHKVFRNKCDIAFKGLLEGLQHDYVVSHDLELYDIFRKLDDNDDGKISVDLLLSTFAKHDKLKEEKEALRCIQDLASDEYIDYEEFLLHLHPNFELF